MDKDFAWPEIDRNYLLNFKNPILCTIVSPNYLIKAKVLFSSLKRYWKDLEIFVLVTDEISEVVCENMHIVPLDVFHKDELGKAMQEKYHNDNDLLRWAMKPVFIKLLLELYQTSSILYCDCDFCFFESPDYIFTELQKGGILLTPHWRPNLPTIHEKNFRLNFKDGLFNAGCIAANYAGVPALTWWAQSCLYACEINYFDGLYHDQKYLDMIPIHFPQAIISRHFGINVADWNYEHRNSIVDGKRLVPELYPIVLVHFSINTIKKIRMGKDESLESYYAEYLKMHGQFETNFDTINLLANGESHNLSNELETSSKR
jgi:hypothetical protein